MRQHFSRLAVAAIVMICSNSIFAAQALDLSHQPASILEKFMPGSQTLRGAQPEPEITENSKHVDFNQTTHIRVSQTYSGYPVWGSDAIVHLPKGVTPSLNAVREHRNLAASNISVDGVFYQDLQADLANTPAYVFNKAQAQKALARAIEDYSAEVGARFTTSNEESRLTVYVDEQQKAHWAFVIKFATSRIHTIPAHPVYVMDAVTFAVYEHWNNIKTQSDIVPGGGFGGNEKIGKLVYDGIDNNRPVLNFERIASAQMCYLRNATVIIKDKRHDDEVPSFKCEMTDDTHKVYWNTLDDAANGGYSPNNDGIYSDMIVRQMYMKWFGIMMLEKDGIPLRVTFYTHDPIEGQNAYYEDGKMVFGEGDDESYPVVAPSVVAHEMSHGFTEQHSGLSYHGMSGGIDEAFSDMADKSIEYYMYGKNNWEIDAELLKDGGKVLRYMDEPTKDCAHKKPGADCSISHAANYKKSMNVHFSSGIFNKAFYLIANKWNTRKAFEVMVQANTSYWTANTNFNKAACGVLKATRDYKYDESVVREAMQAVGVETSKC
jgi:pseudolysin